MNMRRMWTFVPVILLLAVGMTSCADKPGPVENESYDPENPTVDDIPILLEAAKEALNAQYDLSSGVSGIEAMKRCFTLDLAVGKIGKPAIPILIEILSDKDKDSVSRGLAAKGLGELGTVAAEAVPALMEASKENDDDLSGFATRAVWQIDPEAAEKAGLKRPPAGAANQNS